MNVNSALLYECCATETNKKKKISKNSQRVKTNLISSEDNSWKGKISDKTANIFRVQFK